MRNSEQEKIGYNMFLLDETGLAWMSTGSYDLFTEGGQLRIM